MTNYSSRAITPGATPQKWYSFSTRKGSYQKRPPIGRLVLVAIRPKPGSGMPIGIAVGYRKNAAGDKQSPYFVIPGIGGEVFAWCDCLPEKDCPSLWGLMRQIERETHGDPLPMHP